MSRNEVGLKLNKSFLIYLGRSDGEFVDHQPSLTGIDQNGSCFEIKRELTCLKIPRYIWLIKQRGLITMDHILLNQLPIACLTFFIVVFISPFYMYPCIGKFQHFNNTSSIYILLYSKVLPFDLIMALSVQLHVYHIGLDLQFCSELILLR